MTGQDFGIIQFAELFWHFQYTFQQIEPFKRFLWGWKTAWLSYSHNPSCDRCATGLRGKNEKLWGYRAGIAGVARCCDWVVTIA